MSTDPRLVRSVNRQWGSKINPDSPLAKVFIGGMIKLRDIADDDPILDHSRLLKAMENAFD